MKWLGFLQSFYNIALYFNGQETYGAVYIEYLHIVRSDFSLINKLKTQLVSKFKRTNLAPMAYYLDMEVFQDNDIITVT